MTCYDDFKSFLSENGLSDRRIDQCVSSIEQAWEDGYLDLTEWCYKPNNCDEWYEIDEDVTEWLVSYCEQSIL